MLVDGTLAMTIHVEPAHAVDAFRLFGSPGTAMALAALTSTPFPPIEEQPEKPKGGPLARLAGQWCAHRGFRQWLSLWGKDIATEAEAVAMVRKVCGVGSRAELDTNKGAAAIFEEKFRRPYMQWLESAS